MFRIFNFFTNLKIVYFVHGFRFNSKTNFFTNIFFKSIEKILSKTTSVYITINKEDYEYARNNLNKKSLYYKMNGVGLDLPFKKFKQKKIIKNILVIAAYKKQKGYSELIKFAELIKNQNYKIVCFGYGNFKPFNTIKIKKILIIFSLKNLIKI